jgi:uncharacterized membrane protein
MSEVALFELLAAVCALVAAIFIFDQHLARSRPYKLLWALGLLFYAIAAGAAFVGELWGWSVLTYAAWYYFGGVLTAAYLGLGSVYLLGPRRVAHVLTVIAVLASLYAAARILIFPLPTGDAARIAHASTLQITDVKHFEVYTSDEILHTLVIVMNITGAVFLFGGALWSAWSVFRRRAGASRLLSMAMLALGAIFPSILTGLQALGYSSGAAVGELLGAVCLMLGLLISVDAFALVRVPFTHIVLYERRSAAASARR